MKILVMITLIGLLASTVGAYAASMTLSPLQLGGTGSMEVSAPTSGSMAIGWTLTGVQVDGVNITWRPSITGDFTIEVEVGDSEGSNTVSGVINVSQTDFVAISPPIGAQDVSTFEIVIVED
jgi:hypothetical protein